MPKNKKTGKKTDPAPEPQEEPLQNELDEPRWSVVSFEVCQGSGFTYDQAEKKMSELAKMKISGLCIVTDEAASRIMSA